MTDNEIIKALECCVDWCGTISCWACPLKNTGCIHFYKLKETLDLINRQKAEIERLQKHIQEGIDLAKQIPEMVALAQAEAIKEFAERLKEEQEFFVNECEDFVGYVAVSRIDNLVKEMVGDAE